MPFFCTLFDGNYLLKGLAMLRSLAAHCPDAKTYVLCMDEETRTLLDRIDPPGTVRLSLSDIEDEALLAVKPGRSLAEYCWTLSPCLPWYLLERHPEIDCITYLDADLYFFSPVEPLFEEIGPASIAVIEHRFVEPLQHLEIRGRFCVEWVGFRRDEQGLACLRRWREQCIEWCFYKLEEDRMADQKYLDAWPARYSSLHVIEHPGAGLAPWNYARYRIAKVGTGSEGRPRFTSDGEPLVFYHFHQLQFLENRTFDRASAEYQETGPLPVQLYEVYEAELRRTLEEVRLLSPGFSRGLRPVLRVKSQRLIQRFMPKPLKEWLKKVVDAV
jgi:hypothetical protein